MATCILETRGTGEEEGQVPRRGSHVLPGPGKCGLKRLKDRPGDFEGAAAEYESRCGKGVFYHSDPQKAELLARKAGFRIAAHVGSSGIAPLVRESLDRMSGDQFERFLELHLRACSDPPTLGMSLHGLVVAEKGMP